MPRSPDDATRFTATGPHATNKTPSTSPSTSPSTGSRIQIGSAPANETPQQKIARLRAAAALAKRGKEDNFDRMVRIGRVVADRAHRITAYSLLGLTVLSVVVATAGITDLVLHNRARRRDWYKEQELKRMADIDQAKKALAAGTISQDQLLLLAQERAKFEAAESRKNRPGIFKRTSDYLFSGLSKEEKKDGKLGAIAAVAAQSKANLSAAKESMINQLKSSDAVENMTMIPAQDGERAERLPSPGVLDLHAQAVIDAAVREGRSWRLWLTRS